MAAKPVAGLSVLAVRLEELREQMHSFEEQSYEVERQIAELTGFNKIEGSETFVDPDDGTKVTLRQPLYRYVDEAAWKSIEADSPDIVRDCIRWKADVSVSAMRTLEEVQPTWWHAVAETCITTKPGKIGVEVKK